MPQQRRSRLPSYRLHKPSGQAVVTLNGRDFYLGTHGTAASRDHYDRLIAEWLGGHRAAPVEVGHGSGVTIAEILAAYLRFAQGYYTKDGRPTSEIACIKAAMRPLNRLYGSTPAAEFGPLKLMAVREAMIRGQFEEQEEGKADAKPRRSARRTINHHISRIRRIFKWAVANELLADGAVLDRLKAVAGLERGRSDARETSEIGPVPDDLVEKTLPHLPLVIRAMVQFQRLTGCRPGEVCILRPMDIDRSGAVWCYTPASHKTEHRGRDRRIFIGPRAQSELLPWLLRPADAYCFSPKESKPIAAVEPQNPRRRKKAKGTSCRGERYRKDAYCRAIARACDRAGVPPWSPNQLRHSRATEIRKTYGLEAAQLVLGHAKADVTEIYAERDFEAARRIMGEVG